MSGSPRRLQNSEFALLLADMPLWHTSSAAKKAAVDSANQIQQVVSREQVGKNIVREVGGVRKLLVPLQEGATDEVAESALGAILNVVRGNSQNADAVRESKGIPTLVARLCTDGGSKAEAAEEALETLNELTRGNRRNVEALRMADGIPAVTDMLRSSLLDSRERKEALSVLLNIACESNAALPLIGKAGVIPIALAMVATVQSKYAQVLSLQLLTHLTKDPSNRRAAAAADGVALMLDVVDSSREILSRCRAADTLGDMASLKGALSKADVCRLVLAAFALHAQADDPKAICPDATAADVSQLLRLLQGALKAALASPFAEAGHSSTRRGSIKTATQDKDQGGAIWGGAKTVAKAMQSAHSTAEAVGEEEPVADSLSEPDHGLLKALLQVDHDQVELGDVIGQEQLQSSRKVVRQCLFIAIQVEDIGSVLQTLPLACSLAQADLVVEAENWLRARPEAVKAYEEAAAAERSRLALTSLMRMSAAKKAATSLAKQFNIGGPRPEGDGAFAAAWRINKGIQSDAKKLIHLYGRRE